MQSKQPPSPATPRTDAPDGKSSGCLSDTQLVLLVEGSLAPDAAALLDEHVDQCASCRELVGKLLQAHIAKSATSPLAAARLPPVRLDGNATEPAIRAVGHRYTVQALIGQGGMGCVYRAFDRLTGRLVALKQVSLRSSDESNVLSALAQEFRTLATLRHPNIISVLDYGFDARRKPFFTMEFLADAQPLHRFSAGAPLAVRIDLLIQLLQALKYLHRRGIIHRDLKPSNILIIKTDAGPLLKVLDFGLSYASTGSPARQLAGTLPYIAPELFQGAPPSVASDLYAVGVISCEVLTAHHPFLHRPGSAAELIQQVLHRQPDLSGLPDSIRRVLARVLSKSAADRHLDAFSLMRELSQAAAVELPSEPAEARDSYLHAARFVGRNEEMMAMQQALTEASLGRGSAWLVAGESGVGKSRLLEELRSIALIAGLLVMRGQAQPHAGGAYHAWSSVLPGLVLDNEISDLEVNVLGSIWPDLGKILNRAVSAPPDATVQAARVRVLRVLRGVVQRSRTPLVVMLEDLQWADAESLELLTQVVSDIGSLPLLVIGSYRDDEAPRLPDKLPTMRVLRLPRLDQATTAALCESMIGRDGLSDQLIERIIDETEGNTYFIVEIIRALATEAGALEEIGKRELPARIFAGGIEEVVSRRLARLPEETRTMLRLAALAGRQLDLQILAKDTPTLAALVQLSADAGVIEIQEERWRFSHDKLRERLVKEQSPALRQALHGELAERFATVYPASTQYAAQIAYHHREAHQAAQAAHYYSIAGDAALSRGAPEEARGLLVQALQMQERIEATTLSQVRVHRGLAQAEFGLGNYKAADTALRRSFALAGVPLSEDRKRWYGAVGWQLFDSAARRLLPKMLRSGSFAGRRDRTLLHELLLGLAVMEMYVWLGRPEMYIQCTLWALEFEDILDTADNHTNSRAAMAFLLSYTPLGSLGVKHLLHKGHALVPGSVAELAALRVDALVRITEGRWTEAVRKAEIAATIARYHQDDLGLLGCMLPLQLALNMLDEWRRALEVSTEMERLSARTQNPHYEALALIGQVAALLRLAEFDRAESAAERALAKLPPEFSANPAAFCTGMVAVCASQRGQQERAEELAAETLIAVQRADWVLAELRYALIFVLEVYLAADRPERHATQMNLALTRLHRMCRQSPSTQPIADMLQARVDWLRGNLHSAYRLLRRSVLASDRWESQFTQASSRFWLGSFISSPHGQALNLKGGQAYLASALATFERLGSSWESARVRAALAGRGAVAAPTR